MGMKHFTRLEVMKPSGPVRLVRKNAPFGSAGPEVMIQYSVVSQGTERAFGLGLPNTDTPPPRWPFAPGYSASGISHETRGPVACRTWHASHVRCEWTTEIPKGVSMVDAAFTTIGQVAVQALQDRPGGPVVIVGAGLIGRMVDLVARHLGWQTNLIPLRPGGQVNVTLNGHPLVIETSGKPDGWMLSNHLVGIGGEIVVLGSHRAPVQFDLYTFHRKRARVTGAWANGCSEEMKRRQEREFLGMLKRGLSMESLIGEVVPWRKSPAAYLKMLHGGNKPGAIVIDWRGK